MSCGDQGGSTCDTVTPQSSPLPETLGVSPLAAAVGGAPGLDIAAAPAGRT